MGGMEKAPMNAVAPQEGRLFCLDLLRGLDIFLLTVLGAVVRGGIFKVWKPSESMQLFWYHSVTAFQSPGATPTGFGLWDFAQPLFIFVCGAAVPLSLPRRLDADGRPTAAYWKHVLSRVALLWICGMLIRGLLTFDLSKFTPYSDTLQTIAVAYLGAALVLPIRRRAVRFGIALALIAAFGAIQATCGDYSQFGNISRIIDERLFGAIGCKGKDFCYILTTMAWMAMGMIGSLAMEVLTGPGAQWRKAGRLAAWGAASLALGWTLQIWIPPIRYIYTASFIFTTLGYSMLLLAALYAVTDILRFRAGARLFILFGQCSLAAWMLSNFFGQAVAGITNRIAVGLPRLLGDAACLPLARQLVEAAVFIALLCLWRRYRSAVRIAKLHGKGN